MNCPSVLKEYLITLRNTRLYQVYILFCVGVVLLLTVFYLLIKNPDPIIPIEITLSYIILDVNAPTFSSMFLCNYAHHPDYPMHLWNNIFLFCGAMMLIFIFSVLLPKNNFKSLKTFFKFVFPIIFIGFPFTLSGTSIICSRINGMERTVGFSGIDSALIGILTYIAITCLFWNFYLYWEKNPDKKWIWPLFGAALICLCFGAILIYVTEGPNVNIISHFFGYIYGLITAIAVSFLITNPTQKWKYGVAISLVAILIIPTVLWIFL